jgi:hypothetical protein
MASTKTASMIPFPLAPGVVPTASNQAFGTAVYEVMFNPTDNTHISVVGNGIVKMLRYQEGTFKPMAVQKFEQRVF